MGDENAILSEADARHLLRRAAFSATRKELLAAGIVGLTRGAAADKLLNYKVKTFKPGGNDQRKQHNSLLRYLLVTKNPVQEKLALFWHDHFGVGIAKLYAGSFDLAEKLMAAHNKLLRVLAKGNMKDFVKAVGKDPGMIEFLDSVRNEKFIPNENYARELLELFTVGVFDSAGNENYDQADIVQIARAFTGWGYVGAGKSFLDAGNHDFNSEFFATRGPKRIFENKGQILGGADFDVNGEGEAEIDTVVDIIFTHRDTDGENTVARRTARRLLEFYVGPDPDLAVIDAVIAASSFDVNFGIQALVRAIFCHDAFYATARPFGPGVTKSVKWPVDYAIGSMRLLGMNFAGAPKYIPGGSFTGIFTQMGNMGQTLLDPPSVFGWDWETSWLSSSTLLARYNFARDIVASRGGGRFRPDKVLDFATLTTTRQITDAVLDALDCGHNFTEADKLVCDAYLTDNSTITPDLANFDYVNEKLHGLFELVMKSPGFQVF
ncbi:MAG: DUF1800 domain-containing protein [Deltaproteobacteria bacterium]|nr:DUF1800 domain-containing protein [Deltaproteobacteria bacterium]